MDFIFMLTRDDKTVPDADTLAQTAIKAGVRHIGFKDVGLPFPTLRALHDVLRMAGCTTYLEVVSLDEASERSSAEMAVALGVDTLMGGVRPDIVAPLLRGTDCRYYPFAGTVRGHPSELHGPPEAIVESSRRLTQRADVDGLDLLAYRATGDIPALMREVCAAAGKPVIIAGGIDSPDRIAACRESGAAGFTVGTAALNGAFPAASASLPDQLAAIQTAARPSRG